MRRRSAIGTPRDGSVGGARAGWDYWRTEKGQGVMDGDSQRGPSERGHSSGESSPLLTAACSSPEGLSGPGEDRGSQIFGPGGTEWCSSRQAGMADRGGCRA